MQPLTFVGLLGVCLAAFLAGRLVLRPSENPVAARAFAAFLLCGALFVLDDVCYREHWWARVPWFYGVANPFIASITPVFFLYTHAALDRRYRWNWLYLLHLAPAFLLLVLQVPVFLAPVEAKLQMAALDFDPEERRKGLGLLVALDAYFYAYLGAAWWQLWRARERTAESREEGRTHPVRGIGLFATLLLVVGVVTSVLDYTRWAQTGGVVAVLAVVLVVFALLWLATEPHPFLVQPAGGPVAPSRAEPAVPTPAAAEDRPEPEPAAPVPADANPPVRGANDESAAAPASTPPAGPALVEPAATPPAVEPPPAGSPDAEDPVAPEASPDSGDAAKRPAGDLKPEEAARIAARVRRLLETEKVFLDPELSLQALAAQAKTTRHKLSAALRIGFGATFHQLVSGYRVREAARVLATREGFARTIADVAFAAGFNTLSAFNAAFRAHFGVTPREYRDRAAAERAK